MGLLTESLKQKLPPLGSSGDEPLKSLTVHACFRDSGGPWTWYAVEFDGADAFFGLIITAHNALAGQFTLRELEAISSSDGEPGGVFLDETFEPVTVSELIKQEPKIAQIFAGSGLSLVNLDVATEE